MPAAKEILGLVRAGVPVGDVLVGAATQTSGKSRNPKRSGPALVTRTELDVDYCVVRVVRQATKNFPLIAAEVVAMHDPHAEVQCIWILDQSNLPMIRKDSVLSLTKFDFDGHRIYKETLPR